MLLYEKLHLLIDTRPPLNKELLSCPPPEWAKKGQLEFFSPYFQKKKKNSFTHPLYILVYKKKLEKKDSRPTVFLPTRWTRNDYSLKDGPTEMIL